MWLCLSSDGAKVSIPRAVNCISKISQRAQGGFTQNRTPWELPQFIQIPSHFTDPELVLYHTLKGETGAGVQVATN